MMWDKPHQTSNTRAG